MTLFGLDRESAESALNAVRPHPNHEESPHEDAADRFARVVWSVIAEPGDAVASLVVAALGPAAGLTALIDGWSVERMECSIEENLGKSLQGSEDARSARRSALTEGLARWRPRAKPELALRALRLAAHCGARLLVPGGQLWPTLLGDLGAHAPLVLWCRGAVEPETFQRAISIVGARAATGYGEHVALESAASLVDRGFTIVSGGAYGIDGAAHRATLASSGTTVAFLAGGVDRFYPSGHTELLDRIIATGAVISEVPCGTSPSKWRFLQRNRLIAATSRATVVVEAGWRSGSLNTAAHAASLGRSLGAVPGPITSPASAGCHRLIREFAATCVTSPAEIAELAGVDDLAASRGGAGGDPLEGAKRHHEARRDEAAIRVQDALSMRTPRNALDLAARSGLSESQTRAALGVLALEGVAQETERGWRARAGNSR